MPELSVTASVASTSFQAALGDGRAIPYVPYQYHQYLLASYHNDQMLHVEELGLSSMVLMHEVWTRNVKSIIFLLLFFIIRIEIFVTIEIKPQN